MIRLPAQALCIAVALAACNYPGWPGATQPTPIESPTSPPLATLPASHASDCIEGMTVLSESGYLDATPAQAGATLGRTWHVRNSGTCAWTTEYALVPVEGDSFGLDPVPLAESVAPGEETDLQILLTAPSNPGLYSGGWALQSPKGELLGAGSRPLRVRVNVGSLPADPTALVLSMADQMCSAKWVAASPSGPGRLLPCPGYDRDQGGSITRNDAPRFSTGALDDEPALILHPPYEEGGLISGTFPSYAIQAGDQFRVILGCSAGASGCAARFQLNTREGDQLLPIAEWFITEADPPRNLVVDLTFLAGRTVEIVLGVDADGLGAPDTAIWLQPRIVR
ncbi:MAG: NBR1-Ig-like domain-containing protein [Chloroflexi bacterium]|nr:NBR1-Ig-like domain-containing protein [Chloroflexota bacterium]